MVNPQTAPISSKDYLQMLRNRQTNPASNNQPQVATPPQAPPALQNQPTQQVPPAETAVPPIQQPQINPNQAQTTQEPINPANMDENNLNRPSSAYEESELFPGQFKAIPEETIFEWKSPSRPFKKRNRQFFSTIFIIALLVSLILFFAGQFLPIAVVIAVVFLVYVLYTVPPELSNHRLTTYGIRSEDSIHYWEELGRFWVDEKFGQKFISVETATFPGRLVLLIGDADENILKEILSEVLVNEKPKPTTYDKAANWIQTRIPLEN